MLQLTPQRRIFLAVPPVAVRKGSDGLAALGRQPLSDNPLGGAVYGVRNRTGPTLNLLADEGQGFWLGTNRLSPGRFHWWPTAASPRLPRSAQPLSLLFWHGNPERAQLAPAWRPVRSEGTSAAGSFHGNQALGVRRTAWRCSWTAPTYSSAFTPAWTPVAMRLGSNLALEHRTV
jgi:transposase